jgi:hypothetical protein
MEIFTKKEPIFVSSCGNVHPTAALLPPVKSVPISVRSVDPFTIA